MQSTTSEPLVSISWGRTQDRLLGTSLIVAAVALVIAGVLHPEDSPVGMVMPIWGPLHTVLFLALFVALVGVIRVYAVASSQSTWLGLVAFTLFALGIVGFEGVMLLEAAVLPVLAGSDATRALTEEAGALMTGPLGTWLPFIAIAFSVGAITFGLILLRAKDFPRWAGPLLMAAPLFAFEPPIPLWLAKAGVVVFSVGLIGLGWSIRKLPEQPSTTISASSSHS